MLYDAYERELKRPAARDLTEELAAPTLGSVRQIQSGHPADGLTPARLGALLKEAETGDATAFLELAEQMEEKDLHYAAVLGVRKRAIRRLKLKVEPGAEDKRAEDAAAQLRALLNAPTMKLQLINLLDGLGKGYSAVESIWRTKPAPWTITRMKHRDPRWFRFDPVDGQTPLLRDNDGDKPLPPGRFIFHVPVIKSGLPIRGGLARLVTWAYVFKNYSLKDWAIFLEAYGHPLRIGKYDTSATPEDRATLLRAVRRLGVDMAAIMPRSMEVEIQNANVTGGDKMFEGSARYWDEQISKAVLGQVSTTDAIAGGHAVGKVHNEVRDDIRDADAEQLAATLVRDVATPLTIWNHGPDVAVPLIEYEAEEERDPRLTMAAIREFGPRGLKVSHGFVRETYAIREPEDGEDLLTFEPPRRDAGQAKQTAARQPDPQGSEITNAIDRLITSGRLQDAMDGLLGGLLEAINAAESIEDIRDILAEAAELAPDETIRELIAQMGLVSGVAGQTGAEIG